LVPETIVLKFSFLTKSAQLWFETSLDPAVIKKKNPVFITNPVLASFFIQNWYTISTATHTQKLP